MNSKSTANDYPLFEINKDKVRFYYDVLNPELDHSFWTKAVDDANYNKLKNNKPDEDFETIDIILIRTVLDYYCPDDNWYDWDTTISISIDNSGNRHYYLKENFISTWDDIPAYSGGEISQGLFKEYMKKINNHKYD